MFFLSKNDSASCVFLSTYLSALIDDSLMLTDDIQTGVMLVHIIGSSIGLILSNLSSFYGIYGTFTERGRPAIRAISFS